MTNIPLNVCHCLHYLFIIATNGLRIGDGGAFEKRQPNRNTNVEFTTVSPTIANTMLAVRASVISCLLA